MADTFIQSSFLVIIWMVVSLCLNTHFIGILFCSSCSISWCWQIRAYATICSGVSSSRTSSPMHNDILTKFFHLKSNGKSLYFCHWTSHSCNQIAELLKYLIKKYQNIFITLSSFSRHKL